MRSISAADDKLFTAVGGRRVRARVLVKDSGGTWRDLTTYPGHNLLTSVTWKEDVDSNGMDADIVLKREVEQISAAPLMADSPLNRAFDPAAAYAPLIDLARELKIETAVVPEGISPSAWALAFHGYVDTIDAGGGELKVQASGLERFLLKEWIKRERIYAFAQGANALKGCYVFEPSQAYALNELLVPSEAKRNGHFYKCTTAGTTAATEPAWATGGGSTTSSGTAVFTEVGATSTSAGTALETVLQQILDDNLGAGVVTLTTPSSPGFSIRWFLQKREAVWAGLTHLVENTIAWDLRYRYDSGTAAMKLKLIQPDRAKTTPDRTFAASEYDPPERLAIDIANLRNKVRVLFSDSQNTDTQKTPKRFGVEASDSASITRFGEQYMEIQESDTSNIDSSSEATAFATAAVSDLATPVAELGVPLPFFPFTELGDLYRFAPNGLLWSANQDLAVTGYEHSIVKDKAKTALACRGKPSSGAKRWLAKDGRVDPSDTHQTTLGNAALMTLASAGVVGGTMVTIDIAEGKHAHPGEYEVHINDTASFTAGPSTLKATGRVREVTVADLLPGATYYCQVIPFAYNKGRIVRGLPSAELSFVAGFLEPAHPNPETVKGPVPPNGNFEGWFRGSGYPPDHWTMVTGNWDREITRAAGSSARTGGFCIHFSSDTTTAAKLRSAFFPVLTGAGYALSAWVKKDGTTEAADNLVFAIEWYDSAKSLLSTSSFTTDINGLTTAWTNLTESFVAPASAQYAKVYVAKAATNNFQCWVDDIELLGGAEPWRTVGGSGEPTYSNSWVAFAAGTDAQFRKVGNYVELRGAVKDGSSATATIFTLPVGYRPAKASTMPAASNGAYGQLTISTGGAVAPDVGSTTWFRLDGIRIPLD